MAVWNDQQQPWAVHAITCLLQVIQDNKEGLEESIKNTTLFISRTFWMPIDTIKTMMLRLPMMAKEQWMVFKNPKTCLLIIPVSCII